MKLQSAPQLKVEVTHGATTYTLDATHTTVRRVENGIDTATVLMGDSHGIFSEVYKDKVSQRDTVKISEKDHADASWNVLFNGVIRAVLPSLSTAGNMLRVECDGAGYGFMRTACGAEYGTQSSNPTLDTIKEILTDADAEMPPPYGKGVVPKWVNEILGTNASSGFNYDTTNVETITGSINYVYFPYKPSHRVVNDLCDLLTAIKAGSAEPGPHWIVDTDDNFRLKLIGAEQAGWTKYYGGSQANATLEEGLDFLNFKGQELAVEANYVLYHGTVIKPLDMDAWTENNSGQWDKNAYATVTDDSSSQVGAKSIKITSANTGGASRACLGWYPSGLNLNLNIEKMGGKYHIPVLHSWIQVNQAAFDAQDIVRIELYQSGGTSSYWHCQTYAHWIVPDHDKWYEITVPIGPNANNAQHTPSWFRGWMYVSGSIWADIDAVGCRIITDADNHSFMFDGLYVAGNVLRGAKNSTSITNNKLAVRMFTDEVAKDDSLVATDDSGIIAQLAYKELLRLQTTPLIGTFTIPIMPDLLPGQFLHVHAKQKSKAVFRIDKDMRITGLVHQMNAKTGFFTAVDVTDDLMNSHPRTAFGDLNKVMTDLRPEFQDRQATSIKTRMLDVSMPILEKDYPS